ncbi:hypothetical protein CCY99_04745 [Helicobacter sp. 16-1353]|uniref:glycosyltransferase n=1 Tax=Helicobacter sp. 16-1353 TaxID=2004996 RepID=UPI000DCC857C|nr:glycosyltransferase [Helicobacter sp. 16-1353]RAX53994.1 hypothetical protein CCY99_04745 [Helicobacter sp. 16-1353]
MENDLKGLEKTTFFIIVPIYNVEKYLNQCLDSVLNQSYRNFKAILINDGSTDKSGEIAKIYAKNDARFTLINQANYGFSSRNVGLEYVARLFANNKKMGGGRK